MKITNADQFKKITEQFIDDCEQELEYLSYRDAIESLIEAINSPEAIQFTEKMNQYFKSENMVDENGEFLTLERPVNLAEHIIWDGKTAIFSLSESEDRWFRADALYGNKILDQLGFKYTNV